jgi:anaerobic magnesium-protoporphyrin IX monomethyl ester cyclase
MKILLIVPTLNYTHSYPSFMSTNNFPIGFAYLSSSLKAAGFEVFGLNVNNRPDFQNVFEMLKQTLSKAIQECNPDLICTGGICTDYAFIKDTISLCRQLVPCTPIVLGGRIITHDAEFIFNTLKPDFGILGEGEEVLVKLAETLKLGQPKSDFQQIPNLWYWGNSKALFTYRDINLRPFPDYEPFGIQDILECSLSSGYLTSYPRLQPRLMTLIAARSCPFSCTFCVHHDGIKYRARSIKNIIEEISLLYDKYKFNILYIIDELFAVNKTRLQEFSEALIAEKEKFGWDFSWGFATHASASFDKITLKVAKDAGCYFFCYGLESASPTVLKSMEKKTNPSQFIQGIQLADELKIGFGGAFIFGDIAETAETINETMSFFHKHCHDIHVNIGHISPYPGSKLFDYCLENGLIKDKLFYYENIVRYAATINMTKIPERIWGVWLFFYKYFCLTQPWVRSALPLSLKKIEAFEDNLMVQTTKTSLFEIEAQCPHCSQNTRSQSFIGQPKVNSFHLLSRIKTRVAASSIVPRLFTTAITILSRMGPYRHMFSPFRMKNKIFRKSIITGCIHCHKKFRIDLSCK